MPPSDFASNITDPVSIELRLDIFHAKAKSSLTFNCLLLEQAPNSSIVQYLGSWQRLINSSTKGTHHHAHAPYKSAGLDQQRRTGGRCSPRQRSFSRVYARTCFITPYSRRLGRSSISDRHSPALSLRLFSSFFASTFPFLSLSLLHTNQKRSWPNEQVAKRASTPGCGDLTRVLRKATYVFAVFPSFCSLLVILLPFLITCRISVFLGNRSRELTWTVTNRTSSGGWNNLLLAKVIESVKKSFFLPMSRMNLSRSTWTVSN